MEATRLASRASDPTTWTGVWLVVVVSMDAILWFYYTNGQKLGTNGVMQEPWLETILLLHPDLPGLGDSSKPSTGYDGKTVAEDIHQLVTKLGFKTIFLVDQDCGSQPAYSYAAAHPTEVRKLVVMEFAFPCFTPPQLEGKMVFLLWKPWSTGSSCRRKRDNISVMVLS